MGFANVGIHAADHQLFGWTPWRERALTDTDEHANVDTQND